MAKKYNPSIREVLFDYIDVHEDINENKIQQQNLKNQEMIYLDHLVFLFKIIYYMKAYIKLNLIHL